MSNLSSESSFTVNKVPLCPSHQCADENYDTRCHNECLLSSHFIKCADNGIHQAASRSIWMSAQVATTGFFFFCFLVYFMQTLTFCDSDMLFNETE